MAYENCQQELQQIITCKITDLCRIESLFDSILDFYNAEGFMDLFWSLIAYVEQFDSDTGTYYRRMEELLTEGE